MRLLSMRTSALLGLFFKISACGKKPLSIDDVMTKLEASGVQLDNIEKPKHDYNMLLPDTYKEHATFSIPSEAPYGGQVFVCENAKDCEHLYKYFDGFKIFLGSYLYKSEDSLVLLRLDKYLPADKAKKLGDIVTGM